MNKPATLASLLLLACAMNGASAQVYKVVGPDGKVEYTDRPPAAGPGTRTQLIRAGVAKPAVQAGAGAGAATTGAEGETIPEPVRNMMARQQGNPDAQALMRAIRTVQGRRVLVDKSMEMCARMLGAEGARYTALQRDWQGRNSGLLAALDGVMAREIPAEERAVHTKWAEDMAGLQLNMVKQMSPAARHGWCEESAGKIEGKAVNSPDLPGAAVLLNYPVRK